MSEENVSLPVAQALASALTKIEAYVPTEYVDNSEPDLDAEHLNHAEQGIMRVTNLLNAAVDVIQGQQSRLADAENKIGTAALTGGMTDLSSGLNKLDSDLELYNNPITASIVSANNKLRVDSAYIATIAPKIYICYGYVSILNSIGKDENIFAISNLANSSSLLLYGAESGLFTPLLYRNGNMAIPNNVTLQPGYYYVSGTLISN